MKTVGIYEAKTHLPRLIDEVEKGERITITRHGRPVAHLVPAQERDPERIREALREIRALARGKHSTPEEIVEMVKSGRRF